ncbi:MAG TPA: TetR/AcrR family transcriptional regulator [Geobacteraceae bacterium]|nr:TetR/AcrR family transcriptional regulator [Geobacteraceae bacterium]
MTKQDKRDEIIRAALELIAEHGFHGAPMAMIAERAGVGAGTIYRYFENKDVLINELYRELENKLYPYLLDGYEEQHTIRGRFVHLSTALLRYFIAYPLDFRYLEQFYNSPYGAALRREKLLGERKKGDLFCLLLQEGAAQQVLKDLPLTVLAAMAFGPLIYVARDHILGFITLDDQLIERTVEACWDGLKG